MALPAKFFIDKNLFSYYLILMNDELNHWQPSCEEVYPNDFDFDAYDHWLERNELREDDVDAYHESRFDTGD